MKDKVLGMLSVILLATVCLFSIQMVYAVDEPLNPNITVEDNTGKVDKITDSASKIYNTVAIIVQFAAVMGIILVGLKYMFSSSDVKADIKKSMIAIAIGCALVFCAGSVVKIISSITSEVVTNNSTN